MSDLVKKAAGIGGLISIVATVLSGGWYVAEMLMQGREAYAQVRDLKDNVEDLEKRYNTHIEREWMQYKMQKDQAAGTIADERPGADPGEFHGGTIDLQNTPEGERE